MSGARGFESMVSKTVIKNYLIHANFLIVNKYIGEPTFFGRNLLK